MELTEESARQRWLISLRTYIRTARPRSASIGGAARPGLLLLQSLTQIVTGNASPGLRNALLGGLAGFAATALGALPALVLRGISQETRRQPARHGCRRRCRRQHLLPVLPAGRRHRDFSAIRTKRRRGRL